MALGRAPQPQHDGGDGGNRVPPRTADGVGADQVGGGAAGASDGDDSASVSDAIASFWTDALVVDASGRGLVSLMRCAFAAAGASHDAIVAKQVLTRGRKTLSLPVEPSVQAELLRTWADNNCPGMFTFLLAGWVEEAFLPSSGGDLDSGGDRSPESGSATIASINATRIDRLRAFGRQCVAGLPAAWGHPRAPVPRAVRTDGAAVGPEDAVLMEHGSPGLVAAALPAAFRASRSTEWVLLYASEDMGTGANRLTTHVFGWVAIQVICACIFVTLSLPVV